MGQGISQQQLKDEGGGGGMIRGMPSSEIGLSFRQRLNERKAARTPNTSTPTSTTPNAVRRNADVSVERSHGQRGLMQRSQELPKTPPTPRPESTSIPPVVQDVKEGFVSSSAQCLWATTGELHCFTPSK